MSKYPRLPPRLDRIFAHAPLYFVTFCTYRRQPLLANSPVHDAFLAFGQRAYTEHNVAVGRYVIMPDHIHLFVCGDAEFHLGRWIALLKQTLAKATCSRLPVASAEDAPTCSRLPVASAGDDVRSERVQLRSRRAPPTGRRLQRVSRSQAHTIWQRGFFDHVPRSDESYGQKCNYVRDNPVRARLVANADDWPYAGEIIYIQRV